MLTLACLVSCGTVPEVRSSRTITLNSPSLVKTHSPRMAARTRESLQLLTSYPQASFITQIDVKVEPPSALEALEISYAQPERHYRKLGLENGCPHLLRQRNEFGHRFSPGHGLPLRSNELLFVDATWRPPGQDQVKASCEVTLHFELGTELAALRAEPTPGGEMTYRSEAPLSWPDPIR